MLDERAWISLEIEAHIVLLHEANARATRSRCLRCAGPKKQRAKRLRIRGTGCVELESIVIQQAASSHHHPGRACPTSRGRLRREHQGKPKRDRGQQKVLPAEKICCPGHVAKTNKKNRAEKNFTVTPPIPALRCLVFGFVSHVGCCCQCHDKRLAL